MRVTRSVDIEVPAENVWQWLAPFHDVGAWSTSVSRSRRAPDGESRVCAVAGAPGITHLSERLVGFDDALRLLSSEVTDAIPRFVSLAGTALAPSRSR